MSTGRTPDDVGAAPSAVVIGTSQCAHQDTVMSQLYDLRNALPSTVPIWVGGAPFPIPTRLAGRQFSDLQSLWDVAGEYS